MKDIYILLLLFFGISGIAQTNPQAATSAPDTEPLPEPTSIVTDYEHLYTPYQEEQLTDLMNRHHLETGIKIILVTINPLKTQKEHFEEIIIHAGDVLGADKKSIIIGISAGYHRIRIINGANVIPYLSDKKTNEIINAVFVPQFGENQYYQVTVNGINEIVRVIKEGNK
ncbi:TPM domain-containing protein [Flavobacterium rhizosphaerae]|uniref:TPM domain-containing protein n=1 Tax=Flavobacterium rhizosphaerae TaxID=3163298 RepID=A0ABW8YXE8_9FLAO